VRIGDLFDPRRKAFPADGPCIIAEAGVNHEGSMDLAKRLIHEAAEGGADAVKFQTYRARTLVSRNSPSYWDLSKEPTTSQYELFSKHDRFWKKEFSALKEECDRTGIEFLSTPFDRESAAFLDELTGVFKISSSDITNKPFIEYLCSFGKPVILSTGASHLREIEEAAGWVQPLGNRLALMHYVLSYPTAERNANLGMILDLKRHFPGTPVGYSDHTLPGDMKVLEIAALLGAEVIEKHFTFDKTLPGNDHYHAMNKDDLKRFKAIMRADRRIVGSLVKVPVEAEAEARRHARRSLVACRSIPQGRPIEADDLTWKRPGHGISPKHIAEVVGRVAAVPIEEDDILQWDLLTRP